VSGYHEALETSEQAIMSLESGEAVAVQASNQIYLGSWLDPTAMRGLFEGLCLSASIETVELPTGVRIRDTKDERFWFNFETCTQTVGDHQLPGLSVVRVPRDP